jgi:hypothetical protein
MTEPLHGFSNHSVNLHGIRYVSGMRRQRALRVRDRIPQVCELGFIAADSDNVRAVPREKQGRRAAYPARCARNHSYFSFHNFEKY